MTQTVQAPPQFQDAQTQPQYEITAADKKRIDDIALAWVAYKGELDKPLTPMPDEPDDNVTANPCKPVVKTGVGLLFSKEVEITVDENAPDEAQDYLDKHWGRKEARIPLLQSLAMNGAMAGSPFLRIVPDGLGAYELVPIDPSIVYMKTAPQNTKRVLLYCIQYVATEKINGQDKDVFYREEIAANFPEPQAGQPAPTKPTSWTIQHWTQPVALGTQPRNAGWTAAGEPIAWNYPFPPMFHNQNMVLPNDVWGEPDITSDIIGMNNSLNLTLSSTNRVLKIYGEPIIFSNGVGDTEIRRKPGHIIALGAVDGNLTAVQIPSDLANALAHADGLRSYIDELTATPGVATGRLKDMPRGNISGIALELFFMAALTKTEMKRCLYGELIIEVSKALLVLGGFLADIDIELTWTSPLPADDLQAAQAALVWKQIGVSRRTIFERLGIDPDKEMERLQEEAQQQVTNFSRGVGFPPTAIGQPPQPGAPVPGQTIVPPPGGGQQQQGGTQLA